MAKLNSILNELTEIYIHITKMIIEKNGKKYWLPDDVASNPNLTVNELMQELIPYELYLLQSELDSIEKELEYLYEQPDMIQIPNPEKEKIPDLENRKKELINKINEWQQSNQ